MNVCSGRRRPSNCGRDTDGLDVIDGHLGGPSSRHQESKLSPFFSNGPNVAWNKLAAAGFARRIGRGSKLRRGLLRTTPFDHRGTTAGLFVAPPDNERESGPRSALHEPGSAIGVIWQKFPNPYGADRGGETKGVVAIARKACVSWRAFGQCPLRGVARTGSRL